MTIDYIAWGFRRTWKWSLLLYAAVLTEAVFHKGISLPGLLAMSVIGWLVLFGVYLSDSRIRSLHWKSRLGPGQGGNPDG